MVAIVSRVVRCGIMHQWEVARGRGVEVSGGFCFPRIESWGQLVMRDLPNMKNIAMWITNNYLDWKMIAIIMKMSTYKDWCTWRGVKKNKKQRMREKKKKEFLESHHTKYSDWSEYFLFGNSHPWFLLRSLVFIFCLIFCLCLYCFLLFAVVRIQWIKGYNEIVKERNEKRRRKGFQKPTGWVADA